MTGSLLISQKQTAGNSAASWISFTGNPKEERRVDFTHVSAWTNEKLSRIPSEEMTDQKIPDKEILNKELPPKKAPEKEPQEGELSHE